MMDDSLNIEEHWKFRIAKARRMLELLNRLENSIWSMRAAGRRSACTGIIRAVAC